MKTVEEIIKQEPVFLNNWDNKEGVFSDFIETVYDFDKHDYVQSGTIEDVNVLFASYGTDNYSGNAWVLFEKDGKLYEVNGSHCSCYGLEGQWEPEEVVLKELENRLLNGTFGIDDWSDNTFKKELCEFLDIPYPTDSSN